MTGVTAVTPLAPPIAVVSMSLADCASSVISFAEVMFAPSAITTSVSVSPILSAIDAPIPKPPLSFCSALACAIFCTSVIALRLTSPPSVILIDAAGAISARASLIPIFIASEPATPVSPPLAPEIACAANNERLSVTASPLASIPSASGTSASITTPSAVTSPPIRATLLTSATFTATATPTPVPPPAP